MKGAWIAAGAALVITVGLVIAAKWSVPSGTLKRAEEIAKRDSKLEFSDTTAASWREYHSSVGSFKVLFPAYPQHAHEVVPVPNTEFILEYNIYVAEPDETSSYMVSLITYPDALDVSRAENILQTVMNEMLNSNPLNRLTDVKMSEWNGNPQLEFVIENNELGILNRAIMIGHTLYLLTATYTNQSNAKGDYDRFVESFEHVPGKGDTSVELQAEGTASSP